MAPTIDTQSYRSPNFNDRHAGTDISALIFHSCEGRPAGDEQQSSLPWLCSPTSEVSAHYYVTRDGIIYELVPPAKRAWHAGVSVLNGIWNCNDFSLGIELEHRQGSTPYTALQMASLTWLAQRLIAAYAIPKSSVTTHRKVARDAGRMDRTDPTDWDDATFQKWADSLYVAPDPLRARTLAGIGGVRYCSASTYAFYVQRGALFQCGYPLADEFRTTGLNGRDCTVLPCERVVIKTSDGYGVEQALLSEAKARGWI